MFRKLSENYQKNQALRYHPGRFSDKHSATECLECQNDKLEYNRPTSVKAFEKVEMMKKCKNRVCHM